MIEFRSVGFAYESGPGVFGDLSFEIEAGQTVAVLGSNGVGKTTLLRLLGGLREPTAGEIGFDGEDDPVVGIAPERPADGLFARTVREEVAFFPRNRGLPVSERVESALAALGVESLADRSPQTLSAGQRRLVTIAAVLSGDPDLLGLDEPTSGLDATAWEQLADRLEGLDRTTLVVTHDTDFAWRVADSALVLSQDGLKRQGPTSDVLADPAFELSAVGLRVPEAVAWAREHGVDPPPRTVDEAIEAVENR